MARTKNPHAAAVKSWKTRRKNADVRPQSGGGSDARASKGDYLRDKTDYMNLLFGQDPLSHLDSKQKQRINEIDKAEAGLNAEKEKWEAKRYKTGPKIRVGIRVGGGDEFGPELGAKQLNERRRKRRLALIDDELKSLKEERDSILWAQE